jgi:hypothetical protein
VASSLGRDAGQGRMGNQQHWSLNVGRHRLGSKLNMVTVLEMLPLPEKTGDFVQYCTDRLRESVKDRERELGSALNWERCAAQQLGKA